MGQPEIARGNQVTLKDFEAVVKSIRASSKFSTQQLKAVFMQFAVGKNPLDAYIQTIDFKDKFFPGYHWQRQTDFNDSRSGFGA